MIGYFCPGVKKAAWGLLALAILQIVVAALVADWVHSYSGSDFVALLALDSNLDRNGLMRLIVTTYMFVLGAVVVWIKSFAVGGDRSNDS